MTERPTGTVTFLFTDIEGSTKLWQQYPSAMPQALVHHHAILREAIEAHGGYVFQIIGDAFCAAFSTATDGLVAALAAQRALRDEPWGETGPIRVRMALHTGAAEVRAGEFTSGEYVSGLTLSRAARLLSAGHGGQILLSLPAAELARDHLPKDTTLRDLGARRLKDLIRPEQIFQVVAVDLPADFSPLKTLDVYPHNLPVQLTSFVGREREMGEIKKLLLPPPQPSPVSDKEGRVTHLLTLTGAGGVGKTRLVLQVAADLIDEFPDGVWFIELAPLSDPALIPQTVASLLGLREESRRPLMAMLSDYLRAKTTLLILDNCEHLIADCAKFADTILRAAPKVKILATSREALGIAGETAYRVPSLSLPDLDHLPPPPALSQYEAVRLFVDRAVAVKTDFTVTNANAPAVAQICYRLDGIPLAIELAAARVKSLSVEQIAVRLDDRFRLLTGGSRTALPRHQTLRAAIDWSFSLLTEEERVLLRRLSVFVGGWMLEAAQAVCSCDPVCADDVLDLLARLVDKSLVIFDQHDSEARYRMMETIRQYARDRLLDSAEGDAIRDRHLDHFLKLGEQAEPSLVIGDPAWLYRVETEYDNFRAALEYAAGRNAELAVRLGTALDWFWDYSDRFEEGYAWAKRLLDLTMNWEAGQWRARALSLAGSQAAGAGEDESARIWLEAALEMARKIDDKYRVMRVVHDLAALQYFTGNWVKMRPYAEEGLALSRELGVTWDTADSLWQLGTAALGDGNSVLARSLFEQSLEMGRKAKQPNIIAFALNSLARLARLEGDYARSEILYAECAQLRRQMRQRNMLAGTLVNLGQVALHGGDYIRARAMFEESLEVFRQVEYVENQVMSLAGFAGVCGVTGKYEQAARLFGVVEALGETMDSKMGPLAHVVYDPIIDAARQELSEATFNAAWEDGRKMTLEQAIEYALKESNEPTS